MKNPFEDGDIIWFEKWGKPTVVFSVYPDGTFREVGTDNYYLLEEVIAERDYAGGPYRVAQAENWSGYKFRESSE